MGPVWASFRTSSKVQKRLLCVPKIGRKLLLEINSNGYNTNLGRWSENIQIQDLVI